jgi:hypothetical protein
MPDKKGSGISFMHHINVFAFDRFYPQENINPERGSIRITRISVVPRNSWVSFVPVGAKIGCGNRPFLRPELILPHFFDSQFKA